MYKNMEILNKIIHRINNDLELIKINFNKKSHNFTLISVFVGYNDDNLCFKYILQDNLNKQSTMHFCIDERVVITHNGEQIFNKPTNECGLDTKHGIFDQYYCASGEGYELSVESALCSCLHELKIIHFDIVVCLYFNNGAVDYNWEA